MQLLTWHGTIVCLIENGGGLVHVAPGKLKPEHVPVELALEGLPLGTARLAHPHLGPVRVTMDAPARPLTLSRYGRFLSADPKAVVMAFDRPSSADWESFLPVPDRAMALLRHLFGHDWMELDTGRRIARSSIALREGYRLDVGGMLLDVPELLAALPREGDWPPASVTLPVAGQMVRIVPAGDAAGGDVPAESVAEQGGAEAAMQTVAGWALREMAPWRLAGVDAVEAGQLYDGLNATRSWAALYRFEAGDVTLLPKPEALQSAELFGNRTREYLGFFRRIAKLLPAGAPFTLCMCVGDQIHSDFPAPVFSFQKTTGCNQVLLPDIDFLGANFYDGPAYADRLDYEEKERRAVFSGSTTGGLITLEAAQTFAVPRLEAAKHFDGSPRVDVRLPRIVQCPSDEARAFLLSQPFCQKPKLSWQEQFANRFLISMDGNGATCSRVAVALASNCALMKYHSREVLYYFDALQPWVHYVPVERHADVDRVLDMEAAEPARFARIAAQGRAFARTYLTRNRAEHYTAELLLLYAESVGARRAGTQIAQPASAAGTPAGPKMRVMAHIQRRGDVWSGPDGWVGVSGSRQALEGVTIESAPGLPDAGLRYQVASDPRAFGAEVKAGAYAGSRGQRLPLYGLRVLVDELVWRAQALTLEARFADGTSAGPVTGGAVLEVLGQAPLEAIRLAVQARGDGPG